MWAFPPITTRDSKTVPTGQKVSMKSLFRFLNELGKGAGGRRARSPCRQYDKTYRSVGCETFLL